jgi:hypothetical protein
MLQVAHLSKHLWAEAVAIACYLQNHSYTTSLNNIASYELWTGLRLDLTDLQIFGCPAYYHFLKERRKELDSKATKCIFIGYSSSTKGCGLYNPSFLLQIVMLFFQKIRYYLMAVLLQLGNFIHPL